MNLFSGHVTHFNQLTQGCMKDIGINIVEHVILLYPSLFVLLFGHIWYILLFSSKKIKVWKLSLTKRDIYLIIHSKVIFYESSVLHTDLFAIEY